MGIKIDEGGIVLENELAKGKRIEFLNTFESLFNDKLKSTEAIMLDIDYYNRAATVLNEIDVDIPKASQNALNLALQFEKDLKSFMEKYKQFKDTDEYYRAKETLLDIQYYIMDYKAILAILQDLRNVFDKYINSLGAVTGANG